MILLRVAHPPAGAAALIVSLGLIPQLQQLPILMMGVGLLVLQAFFINCLPGIPCPVWRAHSEPRKTFAVPSAGSDRQ